MQDKHTLFMEVFLSHAAVWLSGSFAVEPYDSRQHCCIWFMKTWRKGKQPAPLRRSVVFRVFVHGGPGYHLVPSCSFFEWDGESASAGVGWRMPPALLLPACPIPSSYEDTSSPRREPVAVARAFVAFWLWLAKPPSEVSLGNGAAPLKDWLCSPRHGEVGKGWKGTRFCWFVGWPLL